MKTCNADNCTKTVSGGGGRYCPMHRWRMWTWGQLERAERPLDEIIDSGYKIDDNGCWVWQGSTAGLDYPILQKDYKRYPLHRYMYERFKGAIPDGLVIDHLCRVHRCINPEHLEAVTLGENVLRGTGITAIHAKKTHCINGHEFTEENTRRSGNKRHCRQCARDYFQNNVKPKVAKLTGGTE